MDRRVLGVCAVWAVACNACGLPLDGPKTQPPVTSGPANTPSVIAEHQHSPWGIAVDSDFVYFTCGSGDVSRVRKSGGPLKQLATVEDEPTAIAVDETEVYWIAKTALRRWSKSTDTADSLQNGAALSSVLALDASSVYYAITDEGAIVRQSKTDGRIERLVEGQRFGLGILGLAVNSHAVYFSNHFDETIVQLGLDTRMAEVIAGGQHAPYAVTADDTAVFWTSNNRPGAVLRAAADDRGWAVAVPGQALPWAVAIDSEAVYWLNVGDGTVMKSARDGGAPILIADGQQYPQNLAVDDRFVYWTDRLAGAVLRVEK